MAMKAQLFAGQSHLTQVLEFGELLPASPNHKSSQLLPRLVS